MTKANSTLTLATQILQVVNSKVLQPIRTRTRRDKIMEQQMPFEQLYCALLFLLSRHARSPEPHLPGVIRDHLHRLATHADADGFPKLRDTCNRLALHWHADQQNHALRGPRRAPGTPVH